MRPFNSHTPVKLRTSNQSFDNTGDRIDFSSIKHNEDVVGAMIVPELSDSILMKGDVDDDWMNIKVGLSLDVDFDKDDTESHPFLKSSSGTKNASIIFAVYVRTNA